MKIRTGSYVLMSLVFLFSVSSNLDCQTTPSQSPATVKANSDSVYQHLRHKADQPEDFNGQVATVNGLVLTRDAATFKFNTGEIYFLTPVEGRVIGAVFLGDVEMTLTPPTDIEQRSLARFTGSHEPKPEHFTRL